MPEPTLRQLNADFAFHFCKKTQKWHVAQRFFLKLL
jgi:hypothetical protein